jgi:hypothetical protein
VIDTTCASPEMVAERIFQQSSIPNKLTCWLHPSTLMMAQSIPAINYLGEYTTSISHCFGDFPPIATLYVDHFFFIAKDHTRATAATKQAVAFIPAVIVAKDDEELAPGLTAREYVQDFVSGRATCGKED